MTAKTAAEFYTVFQAFHAQVQDGRTFAHSGELNARMDQIQAEADALGLPFVIDRDHHLHLWIEHGGEASASDEISEEVDYSYFYSEELSEEPSDEQQDDQEDDHGSSSR